MSAVSDCLRRFCFPLQRRDNQQELDLEMGARNAEALRIDPGTRDKETPPIDFKHLSPAQTLASLGTGELLLPSDTKAVFDWSQRITHITKWGLSRLSYAGISALVALPYCLNFFKLSDDEKTDSNIKNTAALVSAVGGLVLGLLVSGTFPAWESEAQNKEQNHLSALEEHLDLVADLIQKKYNNPHSREEAQGIINNIDLTTLDSKLKMLTTQDRPIFTKLSKVIDSIKEERETLDSFA